MTSGALPKTLRAIQIQLLMSPGGRYIKLSLGKDVTIINLGKSKLKQEYKMEIGTYNQCGYELIQLIQTRVLPASVSIFFF